MCSLPVPPGGGHEFVPVRVPALEALAYWGAGGAREGARGGSSAVAALERAFGFGEVLSRAAGARGVPRRSAQRPECVGLSCRTTSGSRAGLRSILVGQHDRGDGARRRRRGR